jgi:hypothetical protein
MWMCVICTRVSRGALQVPVANAGGVDVAFAVLACCPPGARQVALLAAACRILDHLTLASSGRDADETYIELRRVRTLHLQRGYDDQVVIFGARVVDVDTGQVSSQELIAKRGGVEKLMALLAAVRDGGARALPVQQAACATLKNLAMAAVNQVCLRCSGRSVCGQTRFEELGGCSGKGFE